MKRISKGLSWDRISWQVPGEALGGWGWLNSDGALPAKEMEITAGADGQGGAGGPGDRDSLWGPGESGEGYTLPRLPEGWLSIMVRSLGPEPAMLLSHWVASDEVQGHLICKMQTRTSLPSF